MNSALSLLPPIIAIVLCFVTKNVIVSLFAAICVGSLLANGFNFIPPIIDTYMVNGIKGNTSVVVGMIMLGIMLAFIKRAGGFKGFAAFCQKRLNSERKMMTSTFWYSAVLFISGYLANLTLPRIMKVPAKESKTPIMKVPMIISSVCSPISTMTPITMYILFFSGLIVSAVSDQKLDGMSIYISSIPFMFYAIISLIFAFLYAYGIIPDVGFIKKLTKRVKAGELSVEGEEVSGKEAASLDINMFGGPEIATDVWALFAPIIGMVCGIIVLSLIKGSIVVNPAFLVGALVAIIYALIKKRITFKELSGVIVSGVRDQAGILCVLIFAYAFGDVVSALGFNKFVVGAIGSNFAAPLVAMVAFLVCCVISYGTGSLSAAAVIVFPMAVPLALATGAPIPLVVGACVSGSHFGDLTSPVSDNIIMPSEAAGISPVDLSKGLLPYRVVSVIITAIAFLVAGMIMC